MGGGDGDADEADNGVISSSCSYKFLLFGSIFIVSKILFLLLLLVVGVRGDVNGGGDGLADGVDGENDVT